MSSHDLTLAGLTAGILTRWRDVIRVAALVVVAALLLSIVFGPRYQSEATFVVATDGGVQLPKSLSDFASQPGISGLAAQLGVGSTSDPSTSPAFYGQLLASRELLTRLVLSQFPDPRADTPGDSADLLSIYRIREDDRERAVEIGVKRIKRQMDVSFDTRTNLVRVLINDRSPALSAAVANRAVELVGAFNREQRLSRERARRIFLEGRVTEALAELRAAETALRTFYEQNRQWENSPSLTIEERRTRRQVETANELYLSIRREFEAARIDEVNNTPVITIVDSAVPSRKPLWPRYVLVVFTAALLGVVLGLLWAAFRVVMRHWAGQHPADATTLRDAARHVAGEVVATVRRRR